MKNFVVMYLAFIGVYKRFVTAFIDTILIKKSYSQHGEDAYIYDFLSSRDALDGIYVDVGANHPSSISNTFLFYKKGYSGITIEPNAELNSLHRRFRKRDKALQVGINNQRGIFELNISKTPVLSSFMPVEKALFWKKRYVPVLTLDDVIMSLDPGIIFLLSIDTEGLNINVLKGSEFTLRKTVLVCVEVDNDEEEIAIVDMLSSTHDFVRICRLGCNVLLANKEFVSNLDNTNSGNIAQE